MFGQINTERYLRYYPVTFHRKGIGRIYFTYRSFSMFTIFEMLFNKKSLQVILRSFGKPRYFTVSCRTELYPASTQNKSNEQESTEEKWSKSFLHRSDHVPVSLPLTTDQSGLNPDLINPFTTINGSQHSHSLWVCDRCRKENTTHYLTCTKCHGNRGTRSMQVGFWKCVCCSNMFTEISSRCPVCDISMIRMLT